MAYTLTLTSGERHAIDWVGNRYGHGNDLCLLLIGCIRGDEEWGQEGDITFEIPEGTAWAIQEIAEEDNHNWTCFSSDLASKLDRFCDGIV